MLVVSAPNIPFVREAFPAIEGVGEVRVVAGRGITPEMVADAELLLVRSVARIDGALLEGSRVRFVATATIGTDHVDLEYLRSRGIAFASAPGSNARSVAEYVASALLTLESRGVLDLAGSTLGIVGVGNVGSRVSQVAGALGMGLLLNDPPRERLEHDEGAGKFVPLSEIAARSDVVTFDVPLERGGPDPTHHLLGREFLSKLRPGAVVLNTSRGGVADTAALIEAKRSGRIAALVLDVWEGEPSVPRELFRAADIGTPHIAGHSFDGKVAGTRMIFEAACRFLGRDCTWPEGLPPHEDLTVSIETPSVLDAVRASYDVQADHDALDAILDAAEPEARAGAFDAYRRSYRKRREFRNWSVELAGPARPAEPTLRALGFEIASEGTRG